MNKLPPFAYFERWELCRTRLRVDDPPDFTALTARCRSGVIERRDEPFKVAHPARSTVANHNDAASSERRGMTINASDALAFAHNNYLAGHSSGSTIRTRRARRGWGGAPSIGRPHF